MKLSLVVPCYNEQEALAHMAPELEKLLLDLLARRLISADGGTQQLALHRPQNPLYCREHGSYEVTSLPAIHLGG